MNKQKRISRKIFVRWTAGLVFGIALWIWHRITNFQSERENRLEFRHGKDIVLGINYFGRYYIFRNENSVRAFSTVCTHAGCRIGKGSANTLQCNCHGSQFDGATGKPIKGPAIRPLQELECRFDDKSGQWIIKSHLQNSHV